MSYNFRIIWMPGKTHHIADTLLRAPVFGPCELQFEPENIEHCLPLFHTSLQPLDASRDGQYQDSILFLKSEKSPSLITDASGASDYKKL